MPETRWQCLNFCGKTPAAGDRAGRASMLPQHGGSTSPNASGAMAMPQDLWHRTGETQSPFHPAFSLPSLHDPNDLALLLATMIHSRTDHCITK
jgi:hypothetical protein